MQMSLPPTLPPTSQPNSSCHLKLISTGIDKCNIIPSAVLSKSIYLDTV